MKKLAIVALCLAMCSQANAGVWDSITEFFSSSDEVEAVTDAPAELKDVTDKASSSAMVEKGMQLLPMLTQGLNISDNKALGGMGSLLLAVKSIMSDGDYSSLLLAIPNASSFLGAVPEVDATEKKDNVLGSVMAAAGELSGKAKTLSTLNSQFDSLGLDIGMAPKIANTAQTYLNESGKDTASKLLTSAMGKLF
ncbi:MAG: hypothetical protein ACI93R_002813 [Flavobacteriales bacterium]|jgi:hypothetical protein